MTIFLSGTSADPITRPPTSIFLNLPLESNACDSTHIFNLQYNIPSLTQGLGSKSASCKHLGNRLNSENSCLLVQCLKIDNIFCLARAGLPETKQNTLTKA